MAWTFQFPDDRRTIGVFGTKAEAERAVEKDPEFAAEVAGAELVFVAPHWSGQGIPDWPEHMNPTFPGEGPVRGRRHLKALQEKYGTSDYQPGSETRERLKESRERVLHGRR